MTALALESRPDEEQDEREETEERGEQEMGADSEQSVLSLPAESGPVTIGTDDRGQHADGRYECLDCGVVAESFLGRCSSCGASAFRRVNESAETESANAQTGPCVIARVTAPFNPLVPR